MDLLGRRHQFSWLLLVFVLAAHLDTSYTRHHIRHHRNLKDRFKRQQGAHLYLPSSYVTSGGEGRDEGPWSPWSEPSACSRTCGGGVSTQYRTCQEGYQCWGPTRKHFSCNTQDCPDDQDFRALQCSEFNRQPFDGVYYEWVPYTKAPNPCELNCMPRGERFYYRHKLQVLDGTRCSAEKLDVCVEGQCRPVGCDMMLGSNATEDKCRQCGGDGTTCNTISKVLDNMHDLQQGYNDIILIPSGATNILVKEVAPSNNYLAVRNISGDYYLNGNWRIDFPRTLRFAGTLFHYERYPQGFSAPDTLRALGPTDETIFIVLLYQDVNPGISYEYSLPNSVQISPNTEGYVWTFDQFTPCSVSCGRGFQSRNVTCHARNTLEPVERSLCDVNTEPVSKQTCAEIDCEPKWSDSEWGECSAQCGEEGFQTRHIICEKIDAQGYPSISDDEECNRNSGPKPSTKQACNRDVICPIWHTGPWKPCDRLCGEGKQTRKVQCYRKDSSNKIEVLPDSACGSQQARPESEKSCNIRPCEGVDWVTSEWSGCENKCGLANETRRVQCMTQKGEVYNDSLCEGEPKPELVRECKSIGECEHQWYASQWSECSAKCGDGVQTRNVFCGSFKDDTIKKTDDDKCDPSKKYDAIKNCTGAEDACGGEWFTGPWSKCSKKCGGGDKSRKIICMKDDKPAEKSDECDPDIIPFSSEPCNNHPCGDDEILPVDVTKPVDESEPPEEKKGSREELSSGEDEECDEDSEWIDESGEDDGLEKLDLQYEESSSPVPSTDSTMFTDDELMMSDSTQSDTRTTDADQSSTIEGSGDESTTDIISTVKETSEDEGSGSEPTADMTEEQKQTQPVSETSESANTDVPVTKASEVTEISGVTESEIISEKSSSLSGAASSSSISETTSESAVTSSDTSDKMKESTTVATDMDSTTMSSSESSSSSSEASSSVSSSSSSESTESSSSESTESSPSTTDTPTTYETTLVDGFPSTTSSSADGSPTTDSSASSSFAPKNEVEPEDSGEEIVESPPEDTDPNIAKKTTGEEEESTTTKADEDSKPTSEQSITESGATDEQTITGSEETTETKSESESTSTEGITETTIAASTETTMDVSTQSTIESSSGSTIEVTTVDVTSESETTITGETSETDIDIWTTTEMSGTTETDMYSTTPYDIFSTKKPRKCIKKKKPSCKTTDFGCCFDGITPAQGPFDKDCPAPKTCNETKYKCCEDGVSPAAGPKLKGCPKPTCTESLFGCCQDNKTAAEGNDFEGCPPPPPKCAKSKFGCCKDNVTEAKGPKGKGCPEKETTKKPPAPPVDCSKSTHGCCPDGKAVAEGEYFKGCDIFKDNCTESHFGCCPDGKTSAEGPNYRGCKMECEKDPHGCCPDGITPAHGPNHEGCCLATQYGCCPDNILEARGPNLEGCGCLYSRFGCCPDNVTTARGPNNDGCGCLHTEHGCCPDGYTPAAGPEYQGCQCHTFQFGCCPDGITKAKGPRQQGCGCRNTEFGCCSDGETPANGPNFTGCDCSSSKYGCCIDGVNEAQGDNYDGCEEVPDNQQIVCSLPKERGSCRNYTVKWFYDMEYGGCSRFWYGGCEGNGNRFTSTEECKAVCVEPAEPRDVCQLPKVPGPCDGYYPLWHYDRERNQCMQFIYSGCLGNANRFETNAECMQQCVVDSNIDACEQAKEEGPCRGNYPRWFYNKETSQCEQFRYGGCKGNNNNFPTEYACKQKCASPGRKKDHCSLPRAQGSCGEKEPRWYFDSSEKRCMPFYYSGCDGNNNNFISEDACKTDCPTEIERDNCTLPPLVGGCSNYQERWYFDTAEKRCRQFYYGGCDGNGNNFETEEICVDHCDKKIAPPVEPQPEQEPFRIEFCFLRDDAGPCRDKEPHVRWYYDSTDGVCKQFMYGGCQGNGNNFETRDECHSRCSGAQDLCTLPVTIGPCNGDQEQWHYDRTTDSCNTFRYGGCLGNDNRFETRYDCEARCKSGGPAVQPTTAVTHAPEPPARYYTLSPEEEICFNQVDSGNCTDEIPSYFYDPSQHKCTAFMYTGCGGNANRYTSEEQCERQCGRFRRLDVCVYPKDPGPCRSSVTKYYFDSERKRCIEFTYGGCDGSANRFSSIGECESVCISHIENKPIESETDDSSDTICRLPLQVGDCDWQHPDRRYYFNEEIGDCSVFIYSGCGGNFNNFKSYKKCVNKCKHLMPNPPTAPPATPQRPDEPDPCAVHTEACRTIRCPYGMEAYVDYNNCSQCRCHDPCQNFPACEAGQRCGIEVNYNITDPQASHYIAVCKPENKEGTCPAPEHIQDERCSNNCRTDADCMFDWKCCYSEKCENYLCVSPEPTQHTELPSYTKSPIGVGVDVSEYSGLQFDDEEIGETALNAEEGNYVTFKCVVIGNPRPTIQWHHDRSSIDGNTAKYRLLLDGSLQVINLYRNDSGIYVCIADNGLGKPLTKEYYLNVTDPTPKPAFVLGDEDSHITVGLGAPHSLQCYAVGWPRPSVTWWRGESIVPFNSADYKHNRDATLLIQSVKLSNLGVYTCQAYNGLGKAASWSVTVHAIGPVISNNPEDVQYKKYLIDPPSRPDRPEYPFRPKPATQPPYIPPPPPPPQPEPQPEPEQERPPGYNVPVRAEIKLPRNSNVFAVGADIRIYCETDGYPIPRVQWYKGEQPLYPGGSIEITEPNRLVIYTANYTDSGRYRCEANNGYTRADTITDIVVEGVHIEPSCTDNQFFANCALIVKAKYCTHKYYAKFCCRSCTQAGQLPSYGPHLEEDKSSLSTNQVRRK